MIDFQRIIAVKITEKSQEEGIRKAPRLTLIEGQVLDLNAHFFHDFTMDGIFDRLADFGKSGQKGNILVFPAGVFRDQELVTMADGYDDGRADARIRCV